MTDGPSARGPAGSHSFPDVWWTPERAALYRWLQEIASQLAPVYLGALRIFVDESFPGRVHFVGHAIREIRNRIRDALLDEVEIAHADNGDLTSSAHDNTDRNKIGGDSVAPDPANSEDKAPGTGTGETHKQILKRALEAAGGEVPPEYVVKNWFEQYNRAVGLAHVGEKGPSHEAADDINSLFTGLEEALLALMNRSYENLDVLDQILESAHRRNGSWVKPTVNLLTRLESFLNHPEQRAYFFDRLENPAWVTTLNDRGVFGDPPDAALGDLRFRRWPEGRYLVRMSPLVSQHVADILEQLPQSDNPVVTRVYLQIAANLPHDQLNQVAHRIPKWVKCQYAGHFAEEAATVICGLLRSNKVTKALEATKLLLTPRAKPDSTDTTTERVLIVLPEVIGRFRERQYKRVIADLLPVVVDEGRLRGMKVFALLLSKAIQLSQPQDEQRDSGDQLFLWRSAIEDHEQNQEHGVLHVLASATRDAAVQFAKAGDTELAETIGFLENGSALHRRIALHVLATVSHGADLAGKRIGDRTLFECRILIHEYAALIRRRFGEVGTEVQDAFLAWVKQGPDLEEYRRVFTELGEASPSEEQEAAYVKVWQRDWLSYTADYLEGDLAKRYQQLVAEFGEPESPDFLTWSWTSMGDKSPVSKDQMAQWSPADTLEHLRTWQPDTDNRWEFHPSMAGLGRVFKAVVVERTAEFVALSDQIGTLDPTFVRTFLEALREAARKGVVFSWAEPLQLMASVVRRRSNTGDEVLGWDQDRGWRGSRRAAVWLLSVGLSDEPNCVPFEFCELVWQVLEPLTEDPEPSVAYEAKYGGDNLDPQFLSNNTNRGAAMHSVVEYALWYRRGSEREEKPNRSLASMRREVRSVLERHLDPTIDPSLAVRSVYGQRLPQLLHLDEMWTKANLSKIFPEGSGPLSTSLGDTAWSTYIGGCEPYNSVFLPLLPQYEAAARRVPSGRTFGRSPGESVDVKLGEHLVTFYWRDLTPHSLLDQFFQQADDDLAGAVMEYVGRTLINCKEGVTHAVSQRIQKLWDQRLETISRSTGEHRREAQAFAMTFAAAKLDEEWELRSFDRALCLGGGGSRFADFAIERLAQIANNEPAAVTRLTLELLRGSDNDWEYLTWSDEVRAILAATGQSGIPEAVDNRKDIIDHYVSRGRHEFRELM